MIDSEPPSAGEVQHKDLWERLAEALPQLLHVESEDVTLKFLFDHVRNYMICAVLAAGGVKLSEVPITSLIPLLKSLAGALLIALSSCLLLLNLVQGLLALHLRQAFSKVGGVAYLVSVLLLAFMFAAILTLHAA